jgi:hypothetical protein
VILSAGLSRAKFEALLNHTFFIETADHGHVLVRLIAVQVKQMNTRYQAPAEQFSVLFRGQLLPPLPSGLYRVAHLSAGTIELHLHAMPVRRSQPMYRADFSLL